MPIIIDKYTVPILNGPECGAFLKNKCRNPAIHKNYIILLGDQHSVSGYKRCEKEDADCFELQTEFIRVLNEFSKTTRTDFFLEKGHTHLDRLEDPMVNLQNQYFRLKEEPDSIVHSQNLSRTLKQWGEKPGSNMIEMRHMYASCFIHNYKDNHCKYKNILWHSADARTCPRGTGNHFYCLSKICDNTLSYSLKNMDEYSHDSLDELEDNIGGEHSIKLVDGLTYIKLLLTDSKKFIDKIMETRLFQKQYDKLNRESRKLFTPTSFVKLLNHYKSWNGKSISKQYENTIKMFDELIAYYSTKNKKLKNHILLRLNNKKLFPDIREEIEGCITMATVLSGVILDMYFILRINKQDRGNEAHAKLVVGYFGTNHLHSIKYYFTHIVNTHELQEEVGKDADGNRRLHILKDIDINAYLGHRMDEDDGVRPQSKSKSKSAFGTPSKSKSIFGTLSKSNSTSKKREVFNQTRKKYSRTSPLISRRLFESNSHR
ncbi:MAG: hypothetical protein EBQ66_03200 [Flavobacteriia bacterium]|jgi:hypothetical protein|nr:hypothetical protein [Flavobacteriia bacterium]